MVVGSGKLEKAQSGSEKAGEGEGVAARTGQALGAGMEAMQALQEVPIWWYWIRIYSIRKQQASQIRTSR